MRRLLLAAPLLALPILTTACSAGTAVTLGSTTIDSKHVDEVARSFCSALDQVQNGTIPLSAVRDEVVSSLTARAAAQQFGATYGVTAGAAYAQQVSNLTKQLTQFDADTLADVVEVQAAQDYVGDVLTGVGAKLQPSAEASAQATAAQQAFTEWLGEQDLDVNPVYGLDLTGGRINSIDSSISLAVSDTAKSALDTSGSSDVSALPQSQRCG